MKPSLFSYLQLYARLLARPSPSPSDLTCPKTRHAEVNRGKEGATMDATDHSPNALSHFTKIPIAQLSPALEQPDHKCIGATVTLIWPYSSSTKSLSLLLAEPDFRLRRSHGQAKAVFHGRVAEKVAGSHVGIGDGVRLALKGASFIANDATTQTPGRYVAWDVHFDHGVSLQVLRPRLPRLNSNTDPFLAGQALIWRTVDGDH